MELWTVNTDVLVVGAGGAGMRAAIAAADEGMHVVVASKRRPGHGGSTATGGRITAIGAYNCADGVIDADDNPDRHFKDILVAAAGTCNPRLARIVAEDAKNSLECLESIGVPFLKKSGKYIEVLGCFSTLPRSHLIPGHGAPIVERQYLELRRREVSFVNNCSLVDFLVVNDKLRGALFWDPSRGFGVVTCNAAVLATGGAGRLFPLTFSPPDTTGDGYAAALRAGALLTNMEFIQFGFGVLHPVKNELESWVWRLMPKVLSGTKETFLPDIIGSSSIEQVFTERSTHYPFTASKPGSRTLDVLIQQQISEGVCSPHGGVWLDFTSCDVINQDATTRQLWDITQTWFGERGIDLTHQLVEVGIFAHAFNGGIVINEHAETTIEGLFAAGEVASGPHGADRLGGNMLLTSQIFGARAGRFAALTSATDKTSEEVINLASQKVNALLVNQMNEVDFTQIYKQLRTTMGRCGGVVREECGLQQALTWVRQVRERVEESIWSKCTVNQWLDLRSLLMTAEAVLVPANGRKESRGSHFRLDVKESNSSFARPLFVHYYQNEIRVIDADWPLSE